MFLLNVSFNVNLASSRAKDYYHAFATTDSKNLKRQNPTKILTSLLSNFEMKTLALNFQLLQQNLIVSELQAVNLKGLSEIKLGCSEIPM